MANNSQQFMAYIMHLRAEHRRLQQCLRRIERDWVSRESPRRAEAVPKVIEDLQALRAELAHHFEEEQAGGCLEEAVSRHPSFSHDANLLEHEHPVLLAQLDRLIAKLKTMPQPIESADDAREDFRRFADQLHAHEDAESRILQESFGIELG
jgi:hemerythrin-like domain-containing protein